MATSIVFASALFIASLLVIIKGIDLKFGKKSIILIIIGKLDKRAETLATFIKFKSLQLIQIVRYMISVKAKEIIKDLSNKVQNKLADEYRARQEIIMGRKNIVSKGPASFYLKKISENKESGEKGKIEDENLPE